MSRLCALLVLSALLGAACASRGTNDPNRVAIGDAYTVEPSGFWSRTRTETAEVWTVDGHNLEAVWFVSAVEDGDELFGTPYLRQGARGLGGLPFTLGLDVGDTMLALWDANTRAMPRYSSVFTPVEIRRLIGDTLRSLGLQHIEMTPETSVPFGPAPGFRFEISYALHNGLEKRALVVGTKKDERLYLVMYTGTRLYYFDKYRDDVERMIGLIRFQ